MDGLYKRVRQYMLDKDMVRPGEFVAAGVSGGADSLCLFLVLLGLSRELPFLLHVVHVHHGLRESAWGDLRFVEELCRREQIPCTIVMEDAAKKAREWGTGVEEAGRRIRYSAFEKVCAGIGERQGRACRIAVAHHREDQAETVLFRLCRGTDLRGARGMLPVSGRIIRPLLKESRASIEDFLAQHKMAWRQDETNADTSYTRNYLRAEILPRLAGGVNSASAERIAQFAGACAEAERFLERETEAALERCAVPADERKVPQDAESSPQNVEKPLHDAEKLQRDGKKPPQDAESTAHAAEKPPQDKETAPVIKDTRPLALSLPALLREDPYIQGRVLYCCLCAAAGGQRDLGAVHVEALKGLCGEDKGQRTLSMPGRVTAKREGGRLLFFKERDGNGAGEGLREDVFPFREEAYLCRVKAFDGDMAAIPRNQYTKWFDYDKIKIFPAFRARQPGDYMTLLSGAPGKGSFSKKLARVMLDAGVPAGIRDRIVLPFIGREALWLPGVRMGDRFRVAPGTKRILEIRFCPEETKNAVGKGISHEGYD